MPKIFYSKNERETLKFAREFSTQLKGGDILLLEGDLGAGKTTFVKGLAKALGIKQAIKSPTFVLMRQYNIKTLTPKNIKTFVHCDAYRADNANELLEAGLADWLGKPDTVVVVEWGEKILPILKKFNPIRIKFGHGKKEDERVINVLNNKLIPDRLLKID